MSLFLVCGPNFRDKFNGKQGNFRSWDGLCLHSLSTTSGIICMGKQFLNKALCTGLIFYKSRSQSWPSAMFFLMPTPKIPCKFSLRTKAKVQAYINKSIYFWLRSPMKYILRFLLHQNKKRFGKHSAYRLLTRFFFWIIWPTTGSSRE